MFIRYINLLTTSTCIAPFRSVSLAHYRIITNQIIGSYGSVVLPLDDRETVHFGTLSFCSSWKVPGLCWPQIALECPNFLKFDASPPSAIVNIQQGKDIY